MRTIGVPLRFAFAAIFLAALLSGTASAAGCGVLPATLDILGCIPVNVVNAQATPTNTFFDYEFNALPFNAIADAGGNVILYNGISGQLMPAFIENGSVVWMDMAANTIAANTGANGIYYIGIGSSSETFFSSTFGNNIGEAPQQGCPTTNTITCNYGKYDNGHAVFSAGYWNFSGTSLPTNLNYVAQNFGTTTVNAVVNSA